MSQLLRVTTNSEHNAKACDLRWHFGYNLGLATGNAKTPLKHGTIWDECLAVWYRENGRITVDQLNSSVIEPWLEMRRTWTETQHNANELADEDRALARMTRKMLDGYVVYAAGDFERYEVVTVKPQLARWLIHPDTGEPLLDEVINPVTGEIHERRWARGGEADMLVLDKTDGTFWIMENKTTIETDWHKVLGDLAWTSQVTGYAWAADDPIDHPDCDIRQPIQVAGVIYNVARKKVPAQPEPMKSGMLSKAKDVDTTEAIYRAAIHRHGLNEALYADVLERLKGKTFFNRHAVKFTQTQLAEFGLEAAHGALEILQEHRKDHHVRRESVCTGLSWGCQFKSICKTQDPQARASFTVRGLRHSELRGILAESYLAEHRGLK